MPRTVVIAAGGTGGHLYPALRLAKALEESGHAQVLLMGGGLTNSPFVDPTAFSLADVEAFPWKGLSPSHFFRFFLGNTKGFWQASKFLREHKPSALIGFGSYHTVPVMAAACMKKIPFMLYEANSVPGKAVKLFAPRAEMTAVQFPGVSAYFRGNTVQVSMGGRFCQFSRKALRPEALEYFGLSGLRTILLISGGSQGAERINQNVSELFRNYPKKEIQLIHLTGKGADLEQYRSAYQEQGIKACVKAFEERMDLAWSVADLFLGRAGAGTIAEILQSCVPAILIPYPHAAENHQAENGRFISEVVKGGVVISQTEATPERIFHVLEMALEQRNEWSLALQRYSAENKLPSLEETVINFLNTIV